MTGAGSENDAIYGRLAAWLATQGLGDTSLDANGQALNNIGALPFPDLFAGFCTRINEWICPLWRSTLGLEVLNPELSGSQLIWREGALTRNEVNRAGIATRGDYLRSAIYVVDTTNRPFRWHLPQPVPDMELIERFNRENGMTDYFVMPLPFQDATRTSTLSFASIRAGGFSDLDLERLEMAGRIWSSVAERWVLRHIALDLLAHYLGRAPAQRVYAGQIERGDVTNDEAAILICDLRGFTAMTDRAQHGDIVKLLNRWFEVIGGAISAGGEILKFMGDGLLAVFHLEESRGATCDRTLDAALAALAGTETLNKELAQEGRTPLAFGIGLHWGEVEFGNIGTRDRLDFTVIGPAVNLASRLQDLTKVVGTPILASAAFADASSRKLRALGGQRVRGLESDVQVFAPA